jgi:hypothetical protein
MNFLAGPLTRPQLAPLNRLANALQTAKPENGTAAGRDLAFSVDAAPELVTPPPAFPDLSDFQPIPVIATEPSPNTVPTPSSSPVVRAPSSDLQGSQTKPVVPSGISEYYLPLNLSITEAFKVAGEPMPSDAAVAGVLYRPTLLGAAKVRFLDRRYAVDSEITRDAIVDTLDKRGLVRWDDFPYNGPNLANMDNQPSPQARYMELDAPFADGRLLASLQKDFADWVYRTSKVTARANQALKVYAGPDVSPADFRTACSDAARDARDAEIVKLTTQLDRQVATLEDRLTREEREKAQDEAEYNSRKWEEGGNLAELGAGLLGLGRKKSLTSQLSKRRMTEQAKGNVEESIQTIQQYKKQLQELEQRRQQIVQDVNEKWSALVNQVAEIQIPAKKTDVFLEYFGVAWQPFYLIRAGGETYELPGCGIG